MSVDFEKYGSHNSITWFKLSTSYFSTKLTDLWFSSTLTPHDRNFSPANTFMKHIFWNHCKFLTPWPQHMNEMGLLRFVKKMYLQKSKYSCLLILAILRWFVRVLRLVFNIIYTEKPFPYLILRVSRLEWVFP